MPLITYPAGLPAPQRPLRMVPLPRRAQTSIEAKFNVRNRQRDFAGGRYENVQWLYTPEQMQEWRTWYEDTLLYGQLWFTANLPLDGGMATRVVKYVGEERREHLARGIYRVTRSLEVRGAAQPPGMPDPPNFAFYMRFASPEDGYDGFREEYGHVPTVYGATLVADPSSTDGYAGSFFGTDPTGSVGNQTRVEFADSIAFTLGDGDFTIQGRSTFDEASGIGYLIAQVNENAGEGGDFVSSFSVAQASENMLAGIYGGTSPSGGTTSLSRTGAMPLGESQHWAFQRIGQQLGLAIGGEWGLLLNIDEGFTVNDSPLNMVVGARRNGRNGYRGLHDELLITRYAVYPGFEDFTPPTGHLAEI
jgi:hypothetical protein